ncbi:hypothetical protein Acr_26g0001750 [Actinidia rufa]|uniref:Uncharacterized protein n=1 Tax=Actinidia rufa TaxID=165716 RepID=A0A7J0H1L2_9ERIC|nr:hypothetical protein Acr_26g0001750 [Actinidia rufa]
MVTDTKHLRKEFRLFHRYIAHNIISKAGHYNQVTNMDAFIIYKAAMEEPLNLNYIILKEMADVRNYNTRALPFGALLTKIFLHFHVDIEYQPSQGLDEDDMDIEGNPNIIPLQMFKGKKGDERVHEEEHDHEEASLMKIKQQQEIIQNQRRHEDYINRLGDLYEEQNQRVHRIGNLCDTMREENSQQFSNMHADLEGLWNVLGPHPPPPPFDPALAPPRPPLPPRPSLLMMPQRGRRFD